MKAREKGGNYAKFTDRAGDIILDRSRDECLVSEIR